MGAGIWQVPGRCLADTLGMGCVLVLMVASYISAVAASENQATEK